MAEGEGGEKWAARVRRRAHWPVARARRLQGGEKRGGQPWAAGRGAHEEPAASQLGGQRRGAGAPLPLPPTAGS